MAVSSLKRRSGGPMRSNIAGLYVTAFTAEVNGAIITSTNPSVSFTIANIGAGLYTVTFDADAKPRNILTGVINVEEELPLENAVWTGYNAATGVGTFSTYDLATPVLTDFIGTLKFVLFCSDTVLSD